MFETLVEIKTVFEMSFWIILAAIAIESVAEVVTESSLFARFRLLIKRRLPAVLSKHFSCHRCFSLSLAATALLLWCFYPFYVKAIIIIFAVSRLSSYFHGRQNFQSENKIDALQEPQLYHELEEGAHYVMQVVHAVYYKKDEQDMLAHVWTKKVDADKEVVELLVKNSKCKAKRRSINVLEFRKVCPSCKGI